MIINLWMFLSVAVVFGVSFLTIVVFTGHKKKLKELDIEAKRLENANLETLIEDAVTKQLGNQLTRIEVLEAIVTQQNYELNEEITKLK